MTAEFAMNPNPSVAFIEGDGIGPDCSLNAKKVIDAAVKKCYGESRKIDWVEVLAGEKSYRRNNQWLPERSLEKIKEFGLALKGPLSTPVGEGIRSLNVTLRQKLDLYANVRPVRYFPGAPSPLLHPEFIDFVIFRENTEDVYAGIEWDHASPEAARLRTFLAEELNVTIREDAGLGIKPISRFCSERIVRKAILYALKKKRRNLTIVHKGNIMKYTEGAFFKWGMDLLRREFEGLWVDEGEDNPEDKLVVKNRIADNMFQQTLLRPVDHDVIVTTNLNGDYLSDACVAQVGGLGLAPGGNFGDGVAVFEAVHGTAPKYAGLDIANPTSMILSGCMMLEHIQWDEAAAAINKAIILTINQKKVTYDLARLIGGATELKSSQYADALIENLP